MRSITYEKKDVLTQLLQSWGKDPAVAYLGKTQYVIGWKVAMGEYDLTYRLDGDQLIICYFSASDKNNTKRAVAAFIQFIHKLEKTVQQIKLVRGIIFGSLDPDIQATRQRLNEALINKGAILHEIEGEQWLVYNMAQ